MTPVTRLSELVARADHFKFQDQMVEITTTEFDAIMSAVDTAVPKYYSSVNDPNSNIEINTDGCDYYSYTSCYKINYGQDCSSDTFCFKIPRWTKAEFENMLEIFA